MATAGAGPGDLAAIYALAVPAGTTATIVVTFTGAMQRCTIVVASLTGDYDTTPFHTSSDTDGDTVGDVTQTPNINTKAGGVVFGVAQAATTAALAISWLSSLTDDTQQTNEALRTMAGTLAAVADEAPRNLSVLYDTGPADTVLLPCCVAVSFQPPADVTAPVLSNASATATGQTTADLAVDTDEGNGTLSWVVTTSATPPSGAQVAAGQDHTGASAADSGSQAVSGTGTQNISGGATGLTEGTNYWAYFVQDDVAANRSNVASDSFTTDSSPEPPPVGRFIPRGGDIRPEDARKYREYVREIEAAVAARTAKPEKPAPAQKKARTAKKPPVSLTLPEPVAPLDGRVLGSINRTLAKIEERKRRELEDDDEDVLLMIA